MVSELLCFTLLDRALVVFYLVTFASFLWYYTPSGDHYYTLLLLPFAEAKVPSDGIDLVFNLGKQVVRARFYHQLPIGVVRPEGVVISSPEFLSSALIERCSRCKSNTHAAVRRPKLYHLSHD